MKEPCNYRGQGTLKELVVEMKMELTKAARSELNLLNTEDDMSQEKNTVEEEFKKKLEAKKAVKDQEKLAAEKDQEKIVADKAVKDQEELAAIEKAATDKLTIHEAVEEKLDVILQGSVEKEFDESLLLWHIATDLISQQKPNQGTNNLISISETLSEYMLYLLVRQPEMLSATVGIGLLRYRDACAEARRFFKSAAAWDPKHDDARWMLLKVNTSKKPVEVKGDQSKSVLFDACILAKVLLQLKDDTMWKVVAGVRRDMLTYVAGKCHGSTNVRQLNRGGELITLVWFLMAHMGMGDMYRIHEGDAKAKLIVLNQ